MMNPAFPDHLNERESISVTLRHLFTSRSHNYIGHHGRAPDAYPIEEHNHIICDEGKGIRGDRFYGHIEDFKGQITFFSWDVFCDLRVHFDMPKLKPAAFRRNVIIGGVDLNILIDRTFEINGVRMIGTEECRPCYWMDQAVGPGAESFMRGRGGLRAKLLNSGSLNKGEADLKILEEIPT